MKLNFRSVAAAGFALLVAGGTPVLAQAPTPAPPAAPAAPATPPSTANGAVTAIDTTANTITVHDRRSDSDITVTVTSSTKYTKSNNVGIAGLAVGNIVSVSSREDIAAGAVSVDAYRLTILKKLPKHQDDAATNPYAARTIYGTVATLTPALTITAPDNTIITVTTTPETQVLQIVPATFADITVGERVRATGTENGTALTADTLAVQPPRPQRPAGQ